MASAAGSDSSTGASSTSSGGVAGQLLAATRTSGSHKKRKRSRAPANAPLRSLPHSSSAVTPLQSVIAAVQHEQPSALSDTNKRQKAAQAEPDDMSQRKPSLRSSNGSEHQQPIDVLRSSNGSASLQQHSNGAASNGNGHKLSSSSGSHHSSNPTRVQSNGVITLTDDISVEREQVFRLLAQALSDLGCHQSAAAVMQETGVHIEQPYVSHLRTSVLTGQHHQLEDVVQQLQLTKEERAIVTVLVREQKYYEMLYMALDSNDTSPDQLTTALKYLQTKVAPIHPRPQRLQRFASYLLCTDTQALQQASHRDLNGSREALLAKLEQYIPEHALLPPKRLHAMLAQSIQHQIDHCTYHASAQQQQTYSLLHDHQCVDTFVDGLLGVLSHPHSDEILHCAFSHDGTKLVSASADQTIVVWQCTDASGRWQLPTAQHILRGHVTAVNYIEFSPDDRYLLSSSVNNGDVIIWNAATGALMATCQHHEVEHITATAWIAPSASARAHKPATTLPRFVTAGTDRKLAVWQLEAVSHSNSGSPMARRTSHGSPSLIATPPSSYISRAASHLNNSSHNTHKAQCRLLHTWQGDLAQALVTTPNGQYIIASLPQHRLNVYDIESKRTLSFSVASNATALSISQDGHSLLVTFQRPAEHQLYTIQYQQLHSALHSQKHSVLHAATAPAPPSSAPTATLTTTTLTPHGVIASDVDTNSDGLLPTSQVYTGFAQQRFVISASFGGLASASAHHSQQSNINTAANNLILSGSEDAQVYIWHRASCEQPLAVLRGHTATVNRVVWCPAPSNPHMFVSCSDDGTMRVCGQLSTTAASSSPNGSRAHTPASQRTRSVDASSNQ